MSTEHLDLAESRKKLRDLVEDIKIAMMITGFDRKPLNAIPMTTKKVDEEGDIWFLSSKKSDHNKELGRQKSLQLLYSKPGDMKFISVFGHAEIIEDQSVLKSLYSKLSDNWFSGPEDPDLTAIRVRPEEAYYWDSKSNKYLTLLKLGLGALEGKNQDIGRKGKMEL